MYVMLCYLRADAGTPTPAAAGEKRTGFRPRENATLLESSEGHDTKRLGRHSVRAGQSMKQQGKSNEPKKNVLSSYTLPAHPHTRVMQAHGDDTLQ